MPYFNSAQELYDRIGGMFREANNRPEILAVAGKANMTMRAEFSDPEAILTIKLRPEAITIIEGETDEPYDLWTWMKGDDADKNWRGNFNFMANVALRRCKIKGNPAKMLALMPLMPSMTEIYESMD